MCQRYLPNKPCSGGDCSMLAVAHKAPGCRAGIDVRTKRRDKLCRILVRSTYQGYDVSLKGLGVCEMIELALDGGRKPALRLVGPEIGFLQAWDDGFQLPYIHMVKQSHSVQ